MVIKMTNENKTKKKILYIFDSSDWKSRMPVARAAKEQGYNVVIGLLGAKPDDLDALKGFHPINIPRPKARFGLLKIVKTILALRRIIARIQPDIIHTVTIKYSFLVGMSCKRSASYNIIYTMAGLGYLFRSDGIKGKLIRKTMKPFLQWVLRDKRARIIFQNPEDRDLMVKKRYVRPEATSLIIGSGVDLEKFQANTQYNEQTPIVLMPTRLIHDKGVRIFVEAARLLKKSKIDAIFQIAGGLSVHNPRAFTQEQMEELTSDGVVEWLGHVNDMPTLLSSCSLVVYPSYYGEGVPRVLLEACAAGKAVITTEHPGCQEVIEREDHNLKGNNGILVPIKDIQATAKAMGELIVDTDLRCRMGQESRRIAEERFDIHTIVAQTLGVYKNL